MPTPVSRRSLLALTGGLAAQGLALGPLGALPALAAGYGLAPDYRTNWKVHKTSSLASVTQLAAGVRVDTPQDPAYVDQGLLALWAGTVVGGSWELSFAYTVLSRASIKGGSFACFYLNGLGRGTTRYPKSIPSWKNVTPGDNVYMPNARGLRFSFATYNPFAPDVHQRLRLRYFRFQTDGGTLVGDPSPQVFPFETGVPYDVRVRRIGTSLAVDVTNQSTGEPQSFGWNDPRIGQWSSGYIGFRWRGQDAEIANAALKAL